MSNFSNFSIFVAIFGVIAIASKQIGQFLTRYKLPLITGFLFTGIVTGPFGLKLIPHDALEHLRIVDEISLAFIAFAAGSELHLKDLQNRIKSIGWITLGLVVFTFTLGASVVFFVLKTYIPFMQNMSPASAVAVSALISVILVARSPSSAIAVINELRAKGPFTQTTLGVTVVMDVVVIFLFAITVSVADVLLSNFGFEASTIILLLGEMLLSLAIGYLIGRIVHLALGLRLKRFLKAALILAIGLGVFVFSTELRHLTQSYLPFEIVLEPILLCMIGSFFVINSSQYRKEFVKIIHDTGPLIYVSFFTLTGASLEIDILLQTWPIALALFLVRVVGIFLGSFTGGVIAREPMARNRMWWFGFVTQAGVAVGLAKEIAAEFPEWGAAFATLIISLVVLNEVVGPIFFKWAINRIGESHVRAETPEFDGMRDAIIFGADDHAVALAQQLTMHGWHVKIVCHNIQQGKTDIPDGEGGFMVQLVPEYTLEILHQLEAERADAIVALLSDDENYLICGLAYEHFGTKDLIVHLNDRSNFNKFHELGVLIIDPTTAMVSLMDHMVRSPVATSIMLGLEEGQDIIDIEVEDSALDGIALRDVELPDDVLILSIKRSGHVLISHGYTRLQLGDHVTSVGSVDGLERLMVKLGV